MSSYGIKISRNGIDVTTATDEELSLNSDSLNLRVAQKGGLSLNTAPYHDPEGDFVTYTFTIPHNLGYIPGFWVFGINNDSDGTFFKSPFPAHGEISVSANSDANNLYVSLVMATWTMTTNLWEGYYYIFTNEL